MDVKVTGPGTELSVEMTEGNKLIESEKYKWVQAPAPRVTPYNPRDGKLPIRHWASNKGTPLHVFYAICAHVKVKDGRVLASNADLEPHHKDLAAAGLGHVDADFEVTESEFDAAAEAVQAIRIG